MNVWTIRVNRLVIQFASEALALTWINTTGIPGKVYLFLAPRSKEHDFVAS